MRAETFPPLGAFKPAPDTVGLGRMPYGICVLAPGKLIDA